MAMLFYVSGPYNARTLKQREANVEAAMEAGRQLLEHGVLPLVPHFNHLYSLYMKKLKEPDLSHEQYLDWDAEILKRCDGVLKLGSSPGADYEEELARGWGLPVFSRVEQVIRYASSPWYIQERMR